MRWIDATAAEFRSLEAEEEDGIGRRHQRRAEERSGDEHRQAGAAHGGDDDEGEADDATRRTPDVRHPSGLEREAHARRRPERDPERGQAHEHRDAAETDDDAELFRDAEYPAHDTNGSVMRNDPTRSAATNSNAADALEIARRIAPRSS